MADEKFGPTRNNRAGLGRSRRPGEQNNSGTTEPSPGFAFRGVSLRSSGAPRRQFAGRQAFDPGHEVVEDRFLVEARSIGVTGFGLKLDEFALEGFRGGGEADPVLLPAPETDYRRGDRG